MPKVSVYLPEDLYRRARDHGLALSSLTQEAVDHALRAGENADWVRRARDRVPRTDQQVDVAALMDDVRDEFGR